MLNSVLLSGISFVHKNFKKKKKKIESAEILGLNYSTEQKPVMYPACVMSCDMR